MNKIVDEGSATLRVPNEQAFALPGSDHVTISHFGFLDNERFSLVGEALLDLVKISLRG
jgi:hypothetical protein